MNTLKIKLLKGSTVFSAGSTEAIITKLKAMTFFIWSSLLPLSLPLLLLSLLSSTVAQANTVAVKPVLKINPEQCVALMQGQECYVTVKLNWKVATRGDYCLYSSQQAGALQCWTSQNKGDFKHEFMSRTNILITLKQKNSKVILADAEVKMAWVHKKKGKPRMSWRMF